MKILRKTFSSDNTCLFDISASSIDEVFQQTLQHLVDRKLVAPGAMDEVATRLSEREQEASTAIGHSVAVPHCYLDSMIEQKVVFVRLRDPLNLGAPDHIATRYLFVLLGPKSAAPDHLDTLALIAKLMSDDEFRYDLSEASDPQALEWALERAAQRFVETQATPEPEIPEGLEYSGRFAGGFVDDIKRRLPLYASDFKDGIHSKTLASTLFLFFACLAPAVTFGGIMSTLTDSHIGAVEMIAASAICGVIYALFSGQPLIILGGTGPLLVFTGILYGLCKDYEIPFLPTYAWVGIWTAVLSIILAVTDSSCLMRYFTRFTDEIFAALISVIFIYKAVEKLIHYFHDEQFTHDTALLSLLLGLGTYYVATTLAGLRRSKYMLPWTREFLADFGPTIAIAAMALVAYLLHEVSLEPLKAPKEFDTTSGRDWLVDPFEAPMWVRFAAIGPAILAAILLFLDQNITGRLVNAPDHHLQKGNAYHLDLIVVGLLIGLCSMFGLPWLVAATVRSLNHVRSLATTEEVVGAGGERRDRILHVRETRVTGLAIHLMIGASLLLLPFLKMIPMAVLYGLFLYMGIVSMRGNQFFERMSLWAMEPSLYPATHYIRRVPNWAVHAFTAIQLAGLVVLWLVKESETIGILFPLFIGLLVPLRFLMSRWFREAHLQALDADEIPEQEETQWT